MFGMNMMSEAVSPLKENAGFQNFLRSFSNPIIGFVIGTAFTMIIQSSAGTIGVVQTFAGSGMMSYGMCIPVVMGAEVGTCITAILSSFGANKNGKRTALMHLYFNLVKTFVFMFGFYTLNFVLGFDFLDKPASAAGPAVIHTLVNLIGTPLMVPFSGILVTLALRTIPIDEKEKADILAKYDNSQLNIQRSKGLGENEPEMMWQTTMNPKTRRLIKVCPEDAKKTAEVFDLLLGDNLAGRKLHIEQDGHLYLDMLDIG